MQAYTFASTLFCPTETERVKKVNWNFVKLLIKEIEMILAVVLILALALVLALALWIEALALALRVEVLALRLLTLLTSLYISFMI